MVPCSGPSNTRAVCLSRWDSPLPGLGAAPSLENCRLAQRGAPQPRHGMTYSQ